MTYETRQIVKNEINELNSIKPYSYDKYVEFANKIVVNHPFTYFSLLKGQRFMLIWQDICEKTSFINEHFAPNAATRIFYYINKLSELKKCETCGKPYIKNISAFGLDHYFCCNKCAQLHESTIAKTKATKLKNHGNPNYNNTEKTKATCLNLYGVECSLQAKEVKDKCKQSIRDHYGVDHQMKSQEVKDGMKLRYKELHNVEHPFQDPNVQEKIKEKNQKNLGVDWPMQNKELHKVMHKNSTMTKKINYFNDVILHYDNIEPMFNELDFIKTTGSHYMLKWRCKTCGNEFDQQMFKYGYEPRCFKCKPLLTNCNSSISEKELFDFMNSIKDSKYECINGDILNWTTLSNRRQLDIICKRKDNGKIDLAFEFNGLYWHQINEKSFNYHLNKTIECEKLGIRLIHIWEDEWISSNTIKDFIAMLLKDEYKIKSNDVLELDRSKFCKLFVPDCYDIVEEVAPAIIERKDTNNKIYLIEDCGKLICKKK